jgi:hypothetical protein
MSHLTPGQYAALKAAIDADPLLAVLPNDSDGAFAIAAAFNQPAAPAFIVWRTKVTKKAIHASPAFDWTRVDNLSVGKARIWDLMFSAGDIDASQANIRAGIDATWVGTQADLNVRAAVYTQCKRSATRAERVLATGTGSDASPGTLTFEGEIGYDEIQVARSS